MKMSTPTWTAVALSAVATLVSLPAHAGKDLDAIKKRGELICGVNTGLAGFSAADSQSKWSGMDVDVCRSVAAAVLSSPDKVRFVPLTAQQRFTALQSGEIDMLARNTTWTLTRDASLGQFRGFRPRPPGLYAKPIGTSGGDPWPRHVTARC
jgi:general L-amino acid transport system substrate-binding protein